MCFTGGGMISHNDGKKSHNGVMKSHNDIGMISHKRTIFFNIFLNFDVYYNIILSPMTKKFLKFL